MVYYQKNILKILEEQDLSPKEGKNNDSDKSIEDGDALLNKNKITDTSEENDLQKRSDLNDINLDNKTDKEISLFNRFLKEGFDGITTNPNYKLLALLIILLINLSLFLFVGNLGKSFLQNSGLLNQ